MTYSIVSGKSGWDVKKDGRQSKRGFKKRPEAIQWATDRLKADDTVEVYRGDGSLERSFGP